MLSVQSGAVHCDGCCFFDGFFDGIYVPYLVRYVGYNIFELRLCGQKGVEVMKKQFSLHDLCLDISKGGLHGIFANPEFGNSVLGMQLANEVSVIRGGYVYVFSGERSKEQYIKLMFEVGINSECFIVDDNIIWDSDDLTRYIQRRESRTDKISVDKIGVVLVDYIGLYTPLAQRLRKFTEEFGIPVIILGNLPRNSGDFDSEYKPELYTVREHFETLIRLYDYSSFMLFHREHDCNRSTGSVYRYNIGNKCELIIKHSVTRGPCHVYFEYNEGNCCFDI